jgi:site-specific DNA recombinase
MMASVGYLRVSKEDREQQTFENQKQLIEAHCRQHGIPLTEWYLDNDVTGVMPFDLRPEGKRLLAAARRQEFDTVIVYKLDRIGRDTRLILNIISEFADLGIQFVSLKDGDGIDNSSPNGRLMTTMHAAFASLERDMILQRTRDGRERCAAEGTWMGGIVPFGYRRVGERRATRIAPAEELMPGCGMSEADVVRWVFRHIAIERGSTISATRKLNELGVPTRYALGGFSRRKQEKPIPSGMWSSATVYGLLTKPIYKGVATYKRREGEPIEQEVPALVDDALWERAQERLQENAKYSRRNGKRDYLLRGLLRCAHCGHAYTGNCGSVDGKPYPRYGCYSGSGLSPSRARCRVRRLSAEPFEAWVWAKLRELLTDPENFLADIAGRLENSAAEAASLDQERAKIAGEVAGKEAERKRVLSLYRRGAITDGEVDEQLDIIKKEEKALHRRLHAIESRALSSEEAKCRLAELKAVLPMVLRDYAAGSPTNEKKRRLLETFIEHIAIETLPEKGERGLRPVLCHFHYSFGDVATIAFDCSSTLHSNISDQAGYFAGTLTVVRTYAYAD